MTQSEDWHKGYARVDDIIYMGHPYCAGCGTSLGLACLVMVDMEFPPEPTWPFDKSTCPLCKARNTPLHDPEREESTVQLYYKLKAVREKLKTHINLLGCKCDV